MEIPSGPSAFEALADLMAALVWSSVMSLESLSLFFLRRSLVVLLAVLLFTWRTTEEYCLLKRSAIFFGFEIYFPLNFIASFLLAFAPPFRCLISLKSFVGFCLKFMS